MNINKTHYFNAPINKDDFKNLDNMEIISIFNNIKLFFDNVNSNNQYHDLYDFNINDVNDTNISLEKESVSIIDEYFYILKNSKVNERFDINNDKSMNLEKDAEIIISGDVNSFSFNVSSKDSETLKLIREKLNL